MFGCGSSSPSGQSQNNGGGGGGTTFKRAGHLPLSGGPGHDPTMTSTALSPAVTVCVPGSTTNCQTIGGILVDTGSSGLRILSTALTVSLPQQTDSGGNPIAECAAFGTDVIIWGPVQTADVKMAGELASSIPIQVIGSPNFSNISRNPVPALGVPMDDLCKTWAPMVCLELVKAIQDCGPACDSPSASGTYYACPNPRSARLLPKVSRNRSRTRWRPSRRTTME